MRKAALYLVGFLALAAVIGYVATSGLGSMSATGPAGGGGVAAGPVGDVAGATGTGAAAKAPSSSQGGSALPDLGAGSLGDLGLTQIGPRIVKTADLSILVKAGGFNDAFQGASLVAERYGGYVESSSSAGVKHRSGDLLIRVPSDSFEQAMANLVRLGQVESRSISGRDVTSQFVDLQARLTTWEAQETALLRLMRRANTVPATLQIQRELQDVQFRIEDIKGQLRLLQNQTDLATIQVHLHEPGAATTRIRTTAEERPSLVEAWSKALNGFLGVLYATVVGLGYLVPITILGLLVLLGYRRIRPGTSPTA